MAGAATTTTAADWAITTSSVTDVGGAAAAKTTEKNMLPHVSNGNYPHTKRAIEEYLVSKGIPRQTYTAELVMFMERSFKGKYLKGERSHYQHIMPSANWSPGDTLSEKLTRCKDKETFKKRFDRIGTTAILRREHFKDFEIGNLDFKGRMYLRLIDTSHNNLSRFFRNDAVADAFVAAAISYGQEQKAARYGLPGTASGRKSTLVCHGIPEEAYLENPKPLLTIRSTKKTSKSNKGNVLVLVPSPSPIGKPSNLSPEKKDEITNSNSGVCDFAALKECGLITSSKGEGPSPVGYPKPLPPSPLSGKEVFDLWRVAVLANDPALCISARPTKVQVGQAKTFLERFVEFFPASQLPEFFARSSDEWFAIRKYLKANGVWQALRSSPDIGTLLIHSDMLLTWFRQGYGQSSKQSSVEKNNHEKPNEATPVKQASKTPVPYVGCARVTAIGRTFVKGHPESLEYQIAAVSTTTWGEGLVLILRQQLQEVGMDLAASEARIAELSNLPEEELEQYCC